MFDTLRHSFLAGGKLVIFGLAPKLMNLFEMHSDDNLLFRVASRCLSVSIRTAGHFETPPSLIPTPGDAAGQPSLQRTGVPAHQQNGKVLVIKKKKEYSWRCCLPWGERLRLQKKALDISKVEVVM